MKLWLLQARTDLPDNDNPWLNWWDRVHGMVIRAETETQAREQGSLCIGNHSLGGTHDLTPAWLSPQYSTCEELLPDGEPGVLLIDERH